MKGIGKQVRIFQRKNEDIGDNAPIPGKVLTQPAPGEPAQFCGSRVVGDFVILDWGTAYGTVGWAHYLKAPGTSALSLSDDVYGQFWDHMHKIYSALVLPASGLNLDLAPRLEAIDLYPGSRRSRAYEVTWEQVRGILGTAPPWFHWALRDKAAIQEWKPGDPPAVIPADDTEDGRLWLAPYLAGTGLSWGYSGGGPHALARLLDRLLDDITTPPVTSGDRKQPNKGLLALVESAPQDGVTVYKRAQLLAARAG